MSAAEHPMQRMVRAPVTMEKNMAIKIVTDFRMLMQLAQALGQAEKSGDQDAIEKAKAEHDAYRDLCLKADKMNLGIPNGAL